MSWKACPARERYRPRRARGAVAGVRSFSGYFELARVSRPRAPSVVGQHQNQESDNRQQRADFRYRRQVRLQGDRENIIRSRDDRVKLKLAEVWKINVLIVERAPEGPSELRAERAERV